MTASNHVVTGAVIAAVIDKPIIALPLAFISHFVLDALPHFGWEKRDRTFLFILAADMAIAASVLLSIMMLQLLNWPLLVAAGIIASSPDLLWLYYLVYDLKGTQKAKGPFARFASKIQWSETTWGIIMETAWFLGGVIFLFQLTAR
jgi:hypothetical protein